MLIYYKRLLSAISKYNILLLLLLSLLLVVVVVVLCRTAGSQQRARPARKASCPLAEIVRRLGLLYYAGPGPGAGPAGSIIIIVLL